MINRVLALGLSACMLLSACGDAPNQTEESTTSETQATTLNSENETFISLSESEITVDGEVISADTDKAVYIANDIIYYKDGTDETYGEGTSNDMHTAEEASEHLVIHISKAGTYRLSGAHPSCQIFVDLGDDAKNDENAVVTLILDGVNITCSVAPAVLFYNVYECGSKDETVATATVDTSAAGANVIIADGSVNNVNGAYVARIYEPGTTDKLHKYDGAFYSKRSMNIYGGEKGDGVLNITATNEGLDSEMHLTINGGNITISAQNDGINTNEDNISVTTINGGNITINAGLGEEGDGIDSNGYLVINGGTVLTSSCDKGPDGGIDADRDIIVNGGAVMACGNQNGAVSPSSKQQFMQIMLTKSIGAGKEVKVLDGEKVLLDFIAIKSLSSLVLSSPEFEGGHTYKITADGEEITFSMTSGFTPGNMGGTRPGEFGERFEIPSVPEGLDKWLEETEMPDDIREWIEAMRDASESFPNRGGMQGDRPQGGQRPMQPFDGKIPPNA